MIKESSSKFLRVVCSGCGKEQVIFGKVSSRVKCLSCGKLIAKPSGGKTRLLVKVKEVL